jgi:hypothetical protein
MIRLIRERPNPYWGVDPLLAFLFDEVERAESGVEYRREELEDATERTRRLREIFTILEAQRQSGPSAELPPSPTHGVGSTPIETRTAEVIIKLEPGKATYPMPPHRCVDSVDIARRDPLTHPDTAFAVCLEIKPEMLLAVKQWVSEEGGSIPNGQAALLRVRPERQDGGILSHSGSRVFRAYSLSARPGTMNHVGDHRSTTTGRTTQPFTTCAGIGGGA